MSDSFELSECSPVDNNKLPVKKCPKCGRILSVNKGINGLVYFCLVHKDVTRLVENVSEVDTEKVAVSISHFPQELQRFSWAALLFCWIWALARGVWLWAAIMFFAPVLASIMTTIFLPFAFICIPACWALYIWFGFNANRLDWVNNNGNYLNAWAFCHSHRRWEIFMKCFGICLILICLFISWMIMEQIF